MFPALQADSYHLSHEGSPIANDINLCRGTDTGKIHVNLSECVVGQGYVGRAEGETFNHKPSENPCRAR